MSGRKKEDINIPDPIEPSQIDIASSSVSIHNDVPPSSRLHQTRADEPRSPPASDPTAAHHVGTPGRQSCSRGPPDGPRHVAPIVPRRRTAPAFPIHRVSSLLLPPLPNRAPLSSPDLAPAHHRPRPTRWEPHPSLLICGAHRLPPLNPAPLPQSTTRTLALLPEDLRRPERRGKSSNL